MVEAEDWVRIDELWDASLEEERTQLAVSEFRTLNQAWGNQLWSEEDLWWDSYEDDQMATLDNPRTRTLSAWGTREWSAIDSMWVPYTEYQQQQFQSLSAVFDDINAEWEHSPSRFDRDPLTKNTGTMRSSSGPLRVTHEEDWSHWLAYLLRVSQGEFTRRLLGDQFDASPRSVQREVRFHNPGGKTRRVDILAEFDDHGSMIEVKVDDTNYEKTLQTATLVEEQKRGTWKHILLLPEARSGRLDWSFSNQVVHRGGVPRTVQGECEDIHILYWKNVSRALRQTLLSDEESDPQWESSAYVFISLIEQHLCSFEPLPPKDDRALDDDMESEDILFSDIQFFSQDNFDTQITHLEETTEENDE